MKELISSTWEYLIRKINFDLHFDKQVGSKVGGVGESPSRQNRWAVTPDPHSGSEVQGGYERYTWVNLGPSVQSFVLLAEEFRVCPTSVGELKTWREKRRNPTFWKVSFIRCQLSHVAPVCKRYESASLKPLFFYTLGTLSSILILLQQSTLSSDGNPPQ